MGLKKVGLVFIVLFLTLLSLHLVISATDTYKCCLTVGSWSIPTGCGWNCIGPSSTGGDYLESSSTVNTNTACKADALIYTNKVSSDLKGTKYTSSVAYPTQDMINGECLSPPPCTLTNYYPSDIEYCIENGVVYKTNSVPASQSRECSIADYDAKNCGDWKISGSEEYGVVQSLKGQTFLFDNNVRGFSSNYHENSIHLKGPGGGDIIDQTYSVRLMFYMWVYINKTTPGLSLEGQVDDGLDLNIYYLAPGASTLALKSPESFYCTDCDGAHGRDFTFFLPPLDAGWYFLEFQYDDHANNDQFWLKIKQDGNEKTFDEVFSIINSQGPIDIDGDISEKSCTTSFTGRVGAWTYSAVPDQRKCCGDDLEDVGYYDITTHTRCTDTAGVYSWAPVTDGSQCKDASGNLIDGVFSINFPADYYIPSAANGSDACCGDDVSCALKYTDCSQMPYDACPSTPGCLYNILAGCYGSIQDVCRGLSSSECDANPLCTISDTKNYLRDYGYIDPAKQFFCYNHFADTNIRERSYVWSWIDATDIFNSSIVYTLKSEHITDVISNGQKWFYCNAAGNTLLNAEPIQEGESFAKGGTSSCNTLFTRTFGGSGRSFTDCTDPPFDYCCIEGSTSIDFSVSGFEECMCYKDNSRIIVTSGGINNPALTDTGQDGSVAASLCGYDGTGCLNDSYDHNKLCSDPINNGVLCINEQTCTNGAIISTSDTSGKCCVNKARAPVCKDIGRLSSQKDCSDNGGTVYDASLYACTGENKSIENSGGLQCCFYNKVLLTGGNIGSMLKIDSPEQFICYNFENNNIIAQCIYNNLSINTKKINGGELDISNARIRGLGSELHTIRSYDTIDTATGQAINNLYRMYINANGKSNILSTKILLQNSASNSISFNLGQYSYIEFNILYVAQAEDMNITLITNLSGALHYYEFALSDVLINGAGSRRWHHAIIDLSRLHLGNGEQYYAIQFTDPNAAQRYPALLLDNIVAVPSAKDSAFNSMNSYCTGPFGSWISSLNPNSTQQSDVNFWNDKKYLPYELTCDAQHSFDWAGHYCCGYNTRFNYGEFYNDTENGCFNGSSIRNDWTVAYINNVNETSDSGLFDTYMYRDILYYNKTFMACQQDIESGKYSGLYASYSGTGKDTATKLIVQSINDQCTVVGSHYCANNAWRQYIKINGGDVYVGDTPIGLKIAPPMDLIKNGFRG